MVAEVMKVAEACAGPGLHVQVERHGDDCWELDSIAVRRLTDVVGCRVIVFDDGMVAVAGFRWRTLMDERAFGGMLLVEQGMVAEAVDWVLAGGDAAQFKINDV